MRPDTMRVDCAHSDFIAGGNFMSTGFFARAHRVRGGFFALVGLLLFAFALPASAQGPTFPTDKFEYIFPANGTGENARARVGIVGTNAEQVARDLTYTITPALPAGYVLTLQGGSHLEARTSTQRAAPITVG